jgi:putative tryptophan/tyrosine transport system substrate-binding protein
MAAFVQALQEHGWAVGGNVRIDYRWGASDAVLRRKFATELVGLQPNVVLATAGEFVAALQQASRTVPIVFVETIDPRGEASESRWCCCFGSGPFEPWRYPVAPRSDFIESRLSAATTRCAIAKRSDAHQRGPWR